MGTAGTAGRAAGKGAASEAWELLSELFQGQRRRFMALAQEFELAPQQMGALKALRQRGSIPMNELADVLMCDSSNVTGIVDRLEHRGLVVRQPASHDRRVKLLELTERGEELGREIGRRMSQPPPGLAALSAADQRALRDILRRASGDSQQRQ
ncbi:MAG TPA: MarR family transcriptional regulator [Thermoleophilaceae bacterium]